jgi:hypothetical protein
MHIKTRAVSTAGVAVLWGLCGALLHDANAATTDVFVCTPVTVASFASRVAVYCNPPDGALSFFAVCTHPDLAWAARALSLMTTAKVAGKNLNIYFDPADTSGASCGCQTGDCRAITAVEVRP